MSTFLVYIQPADKANEEKTAYNDDFVSQLAAAGEYCYNYPDKQTLINISYNPDSDSGGQFVVQTIPYSLVLEASRNTSSLEEFHSYIDDSAHTELVDIDTDSF